MSSKSISQNRDALKICVLESNRKAKQAYPKGPLVVKIGKHIKFNPDVLDTYDCTGWKPIHYDLLVLSAAVEFADRYQAHGISQWSRHFSLTVPVFDLETWQENDVQKSLSATLNHLTGDDWQFRFIKSQDEAVDRKSQRRLPFGRNKEFVIAYSDGLDSRCVSALCENGDGAIRVRVAKNRDKLKNGDQPFVQIPFEVKVPKSRETSVRSREFKFAAITAIAAQLSSVKRIVVPESGQGALGPVLLPLHNTYPDYRNHPAHFQKMEVFIKALLNHQVTYEQPRLWHTKGQTIIEFLHKTSNDKTGNPRDDLIDTRSCWQNRWNVNVDGKRRQCGLCAACLLRRMSMHAAGIDERPTEQYAFSDLSAEHFSDAKLKREEVRQSHTMIEYGIAGALHLQQLADMAEIPDEELRCHTFELAKATGLPEKKVLAQLRTLLLTHAQEWRRFLDAQGKKSFLRNWTEGGRND